MVTMKITIPTFLTLFRLIVSPLILPLLIVYFLPLNLWWINIAIAGFFVLLCLTDFLDGYLARLLGQESLLGKILDPLADKFLVYATLIALLVIGRIYFYWVILLIGRDFFMMGLRELALEHNFNIRVSWLGKIKTAVLMIFLTWTILNPYYALNIWQQPYWNGIQHCLLALTLLLSWWSAQSYFNDFVRKWRLLNK